MLCRRCAGLVLQAATRHRPPYGGEHLTRPVGYVGVLCAECGALLLPEERAGQLIEKVAQLAQFGLVARGAPLLGSAPGAGESFTGES
jgi:hypothetical protein